MHMRQDTTLPENTYPDVEKYYSDLRQGLRSNANHNKNEAQGCFSIILVLTLASPLFVAFGPNLLLGKIIPASMSVLAGILTGWLQLRKPQKLWAIYRRAQREVEYEKSQHDFEFGNYADADDANKLLAERLSVIAFSVHEKWEGLVPEPEALPLGKIENARGEKDGTS